MSSEQTILAVTALLAAIALGAAIIAVRAVRRLQASAAPTPAPLAPSTEIALIRNESPTSEAPESAVARIVEGRVIVPPTSTQVVEATLGKPLVRISVFSHGLAHALRPESRDRIVAMMRREFQSRRRQRKRAAREAARLAHPAPARATERTYDRTLASNEAWLGELPAPRHAAPISGKKDL